MTQRILVIDDEVDMLMLLRMIIEDNTDYDVETTNLKQRMKP
jgi:DNA-binding NtrC family response regulator